MTEVDPRSPPLAAVQPAAVTFNLRVGTTMHGIDVTEATIRRHGRTYLDRTFTQREVYACGGYHAAPELLAPGLAACFCAKEATIEVLRPTAIMPEWQDIEILARSGGWDRLTLTGTAKQIADDHGLTDLQVSISHAGAVAFATVIGIERRRSPAG